MQYEKRFQKNFTEVQMYFFLAHLQNIGGAQAKKLAIAQVKKIIFWYTCEI